MSKENRAQPAAQHSSSALLAHQATFPKHAVEPLRVPSHLGRELTGSSPWLIPTQMFSNTAHETGNRPHLAQQGGGQDDHTQAKGCIKKEQRWRIQLLFHLQLPERNTPPPHPRPLCLGQEGRIFLTSYSWHFTLGCSVTHHNAMQNPTVPSCEMQPPLGWNGAHV